MQPETHPLKAWRVEAGLTQDELAAMVGVTGAQISMLERRKRGTSVEVASRIADLAGDEVPLSSLTRVAS